MTIVLFLVNGKKTLKSQLSHCLKFTIGKKVVAIPHLVQLIQVSKPGCSVKFKFRSMNFLRYKKSKSITGKCLKPEQLLKAEHLLKHAFPYRNRSFYGPDR